MTAPARSSPVWHPFTQHALEPDVPTIAFTEGAYLVTTEGRRILDAIASWWVITHGHRHPAIVNAIQRAAETLDQVIFAGFTHEPAERLAQRLVELAPPGLAHVFFSDSGSTAVEVGIKMALGFHRRIGDPRSRIVVMQHAYHGDTVGAMSVGARSVFNAAYEDLLFAVDRIPFPAADCEQETLDAFEACCRGDRVAAILIEPLVLGAGGMLMYPAFVLAELKRISEAYGVIFIADEVMTGWGRTGSLFACDQAAITPDILCTSKGLTNGALPLAATLCTPAIFDAHVSTDRRHTFFHSSSFTANPIACAAALANVEIWRNEPVAERIKELSRIQEEQLARFRNHARFENVRRTGTITALDLKTPNGGYLGEIGMSLRRFFYERDLLVRPLGNVIYVLPPYCVTGGELASVYEAIEQAAEQFVGPL